MVDLLNEAIASFLRSAAPPTYILRMKHRTLFFALAFLLLPALVSAGNSERPDLERLFSERGLDGCFVVRRGADTIRVNAERAAMPFRPASTFKIVNALVALESGVAPGTDFLLRWDGVTREFSAWNADLTLEQAFRASAVWWFVELGRLNGRERLGAAMRALDYGNADAAGSDQFWLDGGLRISADGQVRALDRLARGDAPFSPRSLGLLRQIMLLDKGADAQGDWALYAKTGMALRPGAGADFGDARPVAWVVGWVERGSVPYAFALNISEANRAGKPSPAAGVSPVMDLMRLRLELTRELLARLGILPHK
jgi:beta-lactamase class D